ENTTTIRNFSTDKIYTYPNGSNHYLTLKFIKYENGYYYFFINNTETCEELKLTQLTIKLVTEI
ncbi:TPA: hypothetical protein ACGZ9U_003717, partial [Elizabethkingia anophelis]